MDDNTASASSRPLVPKYHNFAIFFPLGAEKIATGRYTSPTSWTAGLQEFNNAQRDGRALPIIFGDAANNSGRLYRWGLVEALKPGGGGTEVHFSAVQELEGHRCSELVKKSDGRPISPEVRRGYSVVKTPAFIRDLVEIPVSDSTSIPLGNHSSSETVAQIERLRAQLESQVDPFEPADDRDGRQRVLATLVRRQGQKAFRQALLEAYSGICAISGCAVTAVLEAAHIVPYRGKHTNHVTNGILLRSDLHVLFDLNLLWIDPSTLEVQIDSALAGSTYEGLQGTPVSLPATATLRPSAACLRKKAEPRSRSQASS